MVGGDFIVVCIDFQVISGEQLDLGLIFGEERVRVFFGRYYQLKFESVVKVKGDEGMRWIGVMEWVIDIVMILMYGLYIVVDRLQDYLVWRYVRC